MSLKYHISKDGTPRKCTAKTVESCRAEKPEGLNQHYSNIEEAQTSYETSQEKVSLPTIKRPLNLPKVVDMDIQKFDEQKYVENCNEYVKSLNEEEIQVLTNYVYDRYNDINSSLYGACDSSPEIEKEIEHLDKALSKCKIKAPKTVWRNFGGARLNKEFHERGYEIGDTVDFHGYSSTSETTSGVSATLNAVSWYMKETDSADWETEPNSYQVKVPEEYGKNGTKGRSTVLCIRTKNAAPVSMFRGRTTEQEWLIPRGKKFKVSEIYKNRELTGGNMRPGTYAHVYVLDEI